MVTCNQPIPASREAELGYVTPWKSHSYCWVERAERQISNAPRVVLEVAWHIERIKYFKVFSPVVTGRGATVLNQKKTDLDQMRKTFFMMRVVRHWHSCPKRLWMSHSWQCPRPGWTGL